MWSLLILVERNLFHILCSGIIHSWFFFHKFPYNNLHCCKMCKLRFFLTLTLLAVHCDPHQSGQDSLFFCDACPRNISVTGFNLLLLTLPGRLVHLACIGFSVLSVALSLFNDCNDPSHNAKNISAELALFSLAISVNVLSKSTTAVTLTVSRWMVVARFFASFIISQ